MVSALLTVAVAFACTGLGWPLATRLGPGLRDDLGRLVMAFLLGATALYLAIFAIGLVRLDRLSMSALIIIAILAAAVGLRHAPWRAWRQGVTDLFRQDCWTTLLALTTTAVALSSLLQGMAPPNDYDSLMYHLTIPRHDVEIGRIEPYWAMPGYLFFPQLMGNFYRLALVLAGEPAVQMMHGLFGITAAVATAALVRRLGGSATVALLGALMFLALRVVIWEMATAEVDVATAAFSAAALIAALAWSDTKDRRDALLLGLMLGAGLCVKYNGFSVAIAMAPLVLVQLARRPGLIGQAFLAAITALALYAPHAAWSWHHVGNPIFPMFNTAFDPTQVRIFDNADILYGRSRDITALLASLWEIFIFPTKAFDGAMIGAPYLLAFAPLAMFAPLQRSQAIRVLGFFTGFYLLWFFLMSQQVRFLLPIFPVAAAFAAMGAARGWQLVRGRRLTRAAFAAGALLLAGNQSLFVAVYAAIRLPAALGIMDATTYHRDTPTMQGAFYETCTYVDHHLLPGERYLALIWPHSYYCPQVSAAVNGLFRHEDRAWLYPAKPITLNETIAAFERENIRFIIIPTGREDRRSEFSRAQVIAADLEGNRVAQHFAHELTELRPLATDRFAAVYEGREILAIMKRRAARQ